MLLNNGRADSKDFSDHCYDIKFVNQDRAVQWIDGQLDVCHNGGEHKKENVCAALKCVSDDDKDDLAKTIADAASEENDKCEGDNSTSTDTNSTAVNMTSADRDTLYSCMTDYAFYDKYE